MPSEIISIPFEPLLANPAGAPTSTPHHQAAGSITTFAKAVQATGSLTAIAKGVHATATFTAVAKGVHATGSITAVAKASLNDNETFTVGDGTNTVTFEFDVTGTNTPQPGNVEIDISAATDADSVAALIETAINNVGAGLTITANATAAVVALRNDAVGSAGNVAQSETVDDAGFVVTSMTLGGDGVDNNETFTVNDGTNPATVFEFKVDSSFVATGGGVEVVDVSADTTADQVAARARTAINSVVAGLTVTALAPSGAVMVLRNDAIGTAGNASNAETVANAGFSLTNMTGGAAGVDNSETFTVRTTVFEFKVDSSFSAAGGGVLVVDLTGGTTAAQTATAMRTAINTAAIGVTAAGSTTNVALTAVNPGTGGNAYQIAEAVADAGFVISGATFAGGVAGVLDAETVTIDDNVNAATVFEFDTDSSVTGGNVAVDISAAVTANDIRDALITAINGVGAGLAITASSGGAATVSLVNDDPHITGAALAETVAVGGFSVTGMTNATGAATVKYKTTYTSSVDGEETAASAEDTEAAGPTTLSATTLITLSGTASAAVASVKIYRTAGGATQGLIGTATPDPDDSYNWTFDDIGQVGDGLTPSSSNLSGTAEPVGVLDLRDKYVQCGGTFTGTIQLQGTVDGTNWVSEGAAITAASTAAVAVSPTYQKMRAVCTAYTSGTPTFTLTGHR
jgi:hypothetical protein